MENFKKSSKYPWWRDPINFWKFRFQVWQIFLPFVWLAGSVALGFVAHLLLDTSLPWWVYPLGFPVTIAISAGKSKPMQRLYVWLGQPFHLRKRSVTPDQKPLMGTTGRYFYRVVNAFGLSCWATWFLFLLTKDIGGKDVAVFVTLVGYLLLFNVLFLVFMYQVDKFVLFYRTRLTVILSILIWTSLVTNYIQWEFGQSGRTFCPFYLCLVGGG